MKQVTNRIAGFMSLGRFAAAAENLRRTGGRGGSDRYDVGWDEALMAGMCDESARLFLDYCGPRCK